jgi:hypothetical protein
VKATKDADRATDDTISRLPAISDAKLRDLLLVAAAEYDERRRERAATMADHERMETSDRG